MRLARELGYKSVDALWSVLTPREWAEWLALMEIEAKDLERASRG